MSVCQTITLERVDVGSSFSYMEYSREYGLSSYMKSIGSRVKVTGAEKVENYYSRNVKLRSAITPVL